MDRNKLKYLSALINGEIGSTIIDDAGIARNWSDNSRNALKRGTDIALNLATLGLPIGWLGKIGKAAKITKTGAELLKLSRAANIGRNAGGFIDDVLGNENPIFSDIGMLATSIAAPTRLPMTALAKLATSRGGQIAFGSLAGAQLGNTLLNWKENNRQGNYYDNIRNAAFSALSLPAMGRGITAATNRAEGLLGSRRYGMTKGSSDELVEEATNIMKKTKYKSSNQFQSLKSRMNMFKRNLESELDKAVDTKKITEKQATFIKNKVLKGKTDEELARDLLKNQDIKIVNDQVLMKDPYTGKYLSLEDNVMLDHTLPRYVIKEAINTKDYELLSNYVEGSNLRVTSKDTNILKGDLTANNAHNRLRTATSEWDYHTANPLQKAFLYSVPITLPTENMVQEISKEK